MAIKSSTYAVLIGVYLLLLGPLLLLEPKATIETVGKLRNPGILLLVAIPFVMVSVLVLVHPRETRSRTELFLYVMAGLTILKLVAFIWFPGSLAWTMKLVDKFPPAVFQCEGLVLIPLGGWLIWWGRKTMHAAARQKGSE